MATLNDIKYSYDDLDEIWPLILGSHPDITNAYYNGDYSKSLSQAQRDKHDWILRGLGFEPGHRLIDIGCGWGPILNVVKARGGHGVGLTLSPRQAESCRHSGFEVHLLDWKELDPASFGRFDAVVSLGAFEHFCSPEEFYAGQQELIYDDFFKLCSDLLPAGGILYLQTMTWGPHLPWGDADPTAEDVARHVSLDAPYYSDARILAYLGALFPGSWLPKNKAQIERVASPYFELVEARDGRDDYIQTLTEWIKAWHAPHSRKRQAMLKLWPSYIFGGRTYRAKIKCIAENAVREVFIRNFFGHQRLFFRKRS